MWQHGCCWKAQPPPSLGSFGLNCKGPRIHEADEIHEHAGEGHDNIKGTIELDPSQPNLVKPTLLPPYLPPQEKAAMGVDEMLSIVKEYLEKALGSSRLGGWTLELTCSCASPFCVDGTPRLDVLPATIEVCQPLRQGSVEGSIEAGGGTHSRQVDRPSPWKLGSRCARLGTRARTRGPSSTHSQGSGPTLTHKPLQNLGCGDTGSGTPSARGVWWLTEEGDL